MDDTIVRIVTHLLPPSFVLGAGVLLASYDDERAETSVGATSGSVPVTPQGTAADAVPVRVRRTS